MRSLSSKKQCAMYLTDLLAAHTRGEPLGIASVCSAHPEVLRQTLRAFRHPLIEATSNQVNQFGGYTGMDPAAFVAYLHSLALEQRVPFENIMIGGDHLGPSPWQDEPAARAMERAEVLVRECARAGYNKLHLDCSMRLLDDPPGPLDVEVAARRAAQLARVAEAQSDGSVCYVVGTEVPVPGGASEHEESVQVTRMEDARRTIELSRAAFADAGQAPAWGRVIALVVQPGVEFGDDFVLPYRPEEARELSRFIEGQPLVYEAHSTDYQTAEALSALVRDHFAILKVGPALTFAFREAVFALAMMEAELLPPGERSELIDTLDGVMVKYPQYWEKYYPGTEAERAFKRRYSLSDRARYYWARPEIRHALTTLMHNLGTGLLPPALLSQFGLEPGRSAQQVIGSRIGEVLERYRAACGDS
jgi:D-tagatose-1,6-bisphosphate aldolase subunit GatZ/KbaZ